MRKKIEDTTIEAMKSYYSQGWTIQKISDTMEISYETVKKYVKGKQLGENNEKVTKIFTPAYHKEIQPDINEVHYNFKDNAFTINYKDDTFCLAGLHNDVLQTEQIRSKEDVAELIKTGEEIVAIGMFIQDQFNLKKKRKESR
jgi:hypothetical protein